MIGTLRNFDVFLCTERSPLFKARVGSTLVDVISNQFLKGWMGNYLQYPLRHVMKISVKLEGNIFLIFYTYS